MDNEVQTYFYKLYYKNLTIKEFEQWVYNSIDLKNVLNPDDYLALISLDYKNKYIKSELDNILKKYIDFGKFETENLLSLLYKALNNAIDSDIVEILRTFYDLYCHGYHFLLDLGLGYGLTCEVPPNKYKAECWEDLTEAEKQEILNSFYPQLVYDINRAIYWLENNRIVLTGEKNNIDHWVFKDNRNDDEKVSTVWTEVQKSRNTKASKLWRFRKKD